MKKTKDFTDNKYSKLIFFHILVNYSCFLKILQVAEWMGFYYYNNTLALVEVEC